jgi:hypothetical protein
MFKKIAIKFNTKNTILKPAIVTQMIVPCVALLNFLSFIQQANI